MESLVNFWKGKRVFLTGHTGFKGTWLVLWLRHLGAEVAGYALDPVGEVNLFSLTNASHGIQDIRSDIRDYPALLQAMVEFRPEIVFHMAAQPLVRYSFDEPVETYSTNVMGTVHLLEAVRRVPTVRAVVNVTSDKCYENHEWVWGYRETDPMGGYDPYSSSKGCAELVTAAWRRSWWKDGKVGIATGRAGNVIGGGDWAKDRLVPDLVTAASENRRVRLRYPDAIRPWQHVLEPLSGYMLLAEQLCRRPEAFSEAWNFGPSEEDVRPVAWVADTVLDLWGGQDSWLQEGTPDRHEAGVLKLDCSKARSRLGWVPRWTIRKALHETVRWYKAWQAGETMREVSLAQIKDYMSVVANEAALETS